MLTGGRCNLPGMSDDGESSGQFLLDHALRQTRLDENGPIGQKFRTGGSTVDLTESFHRPVSCTFHHLI